MSKSKTYPKILPQLSEADERDLIQRAARGDGKALEKIVEQFQPIIFNIALRMVWNRQDAEDVTQEVLIKVITHIASFHFESRFYTWVYRITSNHLINMKKSSAEKLLNSFDKYGSDIDNTPDQPLSSYSKSSSEYDLIMEEVKLQCFTGMLLCLDRRRRLAFILGEVLGLGSREGGEIMNLKPENFRQLLSRGRRQVFSFMQNRCGLVKKGNHCKCHLKAQPMIDQKEIVPGKLRFAIRNGNNLEVLHPRRSIRMSNFLDKKCSVLFQDQPIHDSASFVDYFRDMTRSQEFQNLFELYD
jgi:RNA polymerase sigma factor (sigma-70 family)